MSSVSTVSTCVRTMQYNDLQAPELGRSLEQGQIGRIGDPQRGVGVRPAHEEPMPTREPRYLKVETGA